MRQVNITKLFQKHALKSFEFEDVLCTFPSYGVMLKSSFDLKPFMEAGGTIGCSIVTLPQYSAKTTLNYLYNNYPKERVDYFYKKHPIMVDFETEFWYLANKYVQKRKDGFSKIDGKPKEWSSLYTVPKKGVSLQGKNSLQQKKYIEKLKLIFGNPKTIVSLIVSSMKYAYTELKSTIVQPPTPLILNTGLSLEYALKVNEWFNQYRGGLGLLSCCSYNIHHFALNQNSTYEHIINQIYELNPKIVVLSTPLSENYLEEYIHTSKKPIFNKFVKELALYSITQGAIVLWYNKGHYTSNHGMRILKEGVDGFIYPLKGTCKEGGSGNLPFGQMFSKILNDYRYDDWKRYLMIVKNKGIPCHLSCCEKENYISLKNLTDRQQWDFKRKHELFTRSEQIKQLLEKLNKDGNLDDFEFRLKRNNIS